MQYQHKVLSVLQEVDNALIASEKELDGGSEVVLPAPDETLARSFLIDE